MIEYLALMPKPHLQINHTLQKTQSKRLSRSSQLTAPKLQTTIALTLTCCRAACGSDTSPMPSSSCRANGSKFSAVACACVETVKLTWKCSIHSVLRQTKSNGKMHWRQCRGLGSKTLRFSHWSSAHRWESKTSTFNYMSWPKVFELWLEFSGLRIMSRT